MSRHRKASVFLCESVVNMFIKTLGLAPNGRLKTFEETSGTLDYMGLGLARSLHSCRYSLALNGTVAPARAGVNFAVQTV